MSSHSPTFFALFVMPKNDSPILPAKPWFNLGLLSAVLVSGLFSNGCQKSETTKNIPVIPTTDSHPSEPAAIHAPTAQTLPSAAAAIAVDAPLDVATEKLTTELHRYVAYTRTIPKDFADFIAHDPMQFPPPPAGKKYYIRAGKVLVQ